MGYGSDPENIEKINQEIDKILNDVKTKNFDHKIFENQKISLIKDFENINSNYFGFNQL